MTVFEHVMMGTSLALAARLQQRHGWHMAALAGVAAALPDWDGLTILLGGRTYALGHRVWGHNFLSAAVLGGVAGLVEYRWAPLGRLIDRAAVRKGRLGTDAAGIRAPPHRHDPLLWVAVGAAAAVSHLFADYFYSGYGGEAAWRQQTWPLQLFWPFSHRGWSRAVVPGGNLGTTTLFLVEMFALYRWPGRATLIAWLTLVAWALQVAWWWRLMP